MNNEMQKYRRKEHLPYYNPGDKLNIIGLDFSFCLDKDADIYKPYEKHHSTVKSICESLKDFNIKNLILYHTVDDYKDSRKKEYLEEVKMCDYKGNVIVPEDMEEIQL